MLAKINAYFIEIFLPGLKRYRVMLTSVIGFILVFNYFFTIGVNFTESLPQKVFLIKDWDHAEFKRGQYIAFRWRGDQFIPPGITLVKVVGGVPGDKIEVNGREVRIQGLSYGMAKTHSKQGTPLTVTQSGVVPEGHYYVYTPHKDSYDSRYATVGYIAASEIVGHVIPLF